MDENKIDVCLKNKEQASSSLISLFSSLGRRCIFLAICLLLLTGCHSDKKRTSRLEFWRDPGQTRYEVQRPYYGPYYPHHLVPRIKKMELPPEKTKSEPNDILLDAYPGLSSSNVRK